MHKEESLPSPSSDLQEVRQSCHYAKHNLSSIANRKTARLVRSFCNNRFEECFIESTTHLQFDIFKRIGHV